MTGGLFGCGEPDPPHYGRRIGNDTFAVDCGRDVAMCYWRANQLCTYGWDQLDRSSHTESVDGHGFVIGNSVFTKTKTSRSNQLIIRCQQATFCETDACPGGSRCVQSKRYPGRLVCSVQ